MAYGNAGRWSRWRHADGGGRLGPTHPLGLETLCPFCVALWGFVFVLVLVLLPASLGVCWVPPGVLPLFFWVLQPGSSSLLGSSGPPHPFQLWIVP